MRLEKEKPASVRLMDHATARLFWDMARLADEKRRAEKRYKDLFDFAREGLALVSESGEIIECNFSLAHLLGHSRPELDGKPVFEARRQRIEKNPPVSPRRFENSRFHDRGNGFRGKRTVETRPVEASITWLPEERLFRMMLRDISASRKARGIEAGLFGAIGGGGRKADGKTEGLGRGDTPPETNTPRASFTIPPSPYSS